MVRAAILEASKLDAKIISSDWGALCNNSYLMRRFYEIFAPGCQPPSTDPYRPLDDPEELSAGFVGRVASAAMYIADALGPKQAREMIQSGEQLRTTLLSVLRSGEHGPVVYVNRKGQPSYPTWGIPFADNGLHLVSEGLVQLEPVHPELEQVGPAFYDLAKLRYWKPADQKNTGNISTEAIYEELKSGDVLKNCLGLLDGEQIAAKSDRILRQFDTLYLWKSVCCFQGKMHVPCVQEGTYRISWRDWFRADQLAPQYPEL